MKKQSVFQNKAKADDQKARLSRLREEWKAFPAALGLACVCVLLGKLLPIREDWMYRILWICDCAAIILCYLATWLLLRRINKKYNDRKLPEFHASLMEKQQEVEANLEKAAARVERRLQFAWVWYVGVLLLVCCNALLYVPAKLWLPVLLLDIYILWGLLSIWFDREKTENPKEELSREEYPVIHELVDRAAGTAGCKLPIRVFLGGNTVGIVRRPAEVWILLDAVTCAIFTKQELYHALLHEFAHELNEDTLRSLRIERELSRWGNVKEGVLTSIGGYLLNLPVGLIALDFTLYDLFSHRKRETLADAEAVRWGSAQELVNGLAKLNAWAIFEGSPIPELSLYTEYAGEEPRDDIPATALRLYKEMLPQKREKWRKRLDVELPPRVSTHPIFRQRREAFGVETYTFEAEETDQTYLDETKALVDRAGKAIRDQMAENYAENRKQYYLDRKVLVDKAEAVTDWSALTIDERIELAKALAVLEPELQETAIQSILTDDPENVYGIMLLGTKRFRENDPACVELLKKAAKENFNFVEPAYDMLGDYARCAGQQELLDEYRAEVAEAVQGAWDKQEDLGLSWKGKERISENDMEPERFARVRDAIAERTEGKLAHLYTVRQDTAQGVCFCYLLDFRPELSKEEQHRLYEQVFLYLDYLPDEEYYSLEDITGEPKKREYLLRRVPGCEIPLPHDNGDVTGQTQS